MKSECNDLEILFKKNLMYHFNKHNGAILNVEFEKRLGQGHVYHLFFNNNR